jgi:hypothetical protein
MCACVGACIGAHTSVTCVRHGGGEREAGGLAGLGWESDAGLIQEDGRLFKATTPWKNEKSDAQDDADDLTKAFEVAPLRCTPASSVDAHATLACRREVSRRCISSKPSCTRISAARASSLCDLRHRPIYP